MTELRRGCRILLLQGELALQLFNLPIAFRQFVAESRVFTP
jgi:hypothetical protein